MAVRAYGKSVQSYTAWAAETEYSLEDFRVPTTDNGMCYECTTAGTSHTPEEGEPIIEPTWPLVVTETVVDGTVVWTCREKTATPAALTVTLDLGDSGGCRFKEVWLKSDDNVTFSVQVSYSGADGTWRELDSQNVNDAEEFHQYATSYRFTKVSTETVASNEIEIVAGA